MPHCDMLTLNQPLRCVANDPLERFLDEALLFVIPLLILIP
ncbi:MAG: hypothetical protein ACR5LD_08305 [Symbiopectobacterium sp.]